MLKMLQPSHFSKGCDKMYFRLTAVSGNISSSAWVKNVLKFSVTTTVSLEKLFNENILFSHFCFAVAELRLPHEVSDGLHELKLVFRVGKLQNLIKGLKTLFTFCMVLDDKLTPSSSSSSSSPSFLTTLLRVLSFDHFDMMRFMLFLCHCFGKCFGLACELDLLINHLHIDSN